MHTDAEVHPEPPGSGPVKGLYTWLMPERWPRWLVYVFAVAVVGTTLLLRLAIAETFFDRPLLILFVLPILLSAYLGGLGPGLLATLAAALGVSYRLIPPTYSLAIDKSADVIQLAILVLNGVLISVLNEALHRSRRHVEASRLLQAVTLDSIGDAVITTDKQGRITFLNPEAERLTGWSRQEAQGQPLPAVFRIINEHTRENMADPVKKVLASGMVINLANHTLLQARDGREIAIAESGAPIKLPDGRLFGVVLVFRDYTAERQAAAALKNSEEHYRSLFENLPYGFVYCQMLFDQGRPVDLVHLEVNRTFEAITGLTNVVGKKVSEVIPGLMEANPEFFAIHGRVALTGQPESFEMYVHGLQKWLAVTVYSPEKEHFVAVFDDITERRQAEAALRESHQTLNVLLNAVPEAILLIDTERNIIAANQTYARRMGKSLAELIGSKIFDLLPSEVVARRRTHADEVIRTGQAGRFEDLRDGRFFDNAIHPILDATGKVAKLAILSLDITDRKQTEEALRSSEEKFRLAMETIQEGMWDWLIPSDEIYISPGFLRSFGYDPEKVARTLNAWMAAIHPEDLPRFQEILQAYLAGHLPSFTVEMRVRIGDGQYRWFTSRGRVVEQAPDGAPLRMVGALRDITEEKQARQALEESLSLYQATLESTADGLLVVNSEGRTVSWNHKFAEMWRLPEDIVNSRDDDQALAFVVDQLVDPRGFLQKVRELYGQRQAESFDVLHFKDGRVFERYSMPQYLDDQIVGRVWSFRDVTTRVQAEAALKQSEAEYRRIVETANEGIWAVDQEHRTSYVNQLMAEMMGYSWEEMQGRLVTDFMFPEDLPDHQEKVDRRHRGKYERRLRRKDGSELWTIVSVRALIGKAGEFLGSFAMLTDITDRVRAEKKLKESERRVRAKLESILAPEGDIGQLDLEDILDAEAIQSLMEDFYQLTHLPIGLIDLQGKVLVVVGWQDICAKFHRNHPETCQRCLESDTILSRDVPPGTYKMYKCKNNMWDMATPVMVGGKHVGNLFLGQFLFEDEEPDYEFFRAQAQQFGFDEASYLAALAAVPRVSRETVDRAMGFFTKLAHIISQLSLSNIKLARAVTEQERLVESLRLSEEKSRADEEFLSDIFSSIKDGLTILDLDRNIIRVNPAVRQLAPTKDLVGKKCYEAFHHRDSICPNCPVEHTIRTGEANLAILEGDTLGWNTYCIELHSYPLINRSTGQLRGVIEYGRDISAAKHAAEALARSHGELQKTAQELEQSRNTLQQILESIPVRVFWKDIESLLLGCNSLFAHDAGFHHPEEVLGKDDFAMGWRDQAELYRADDRQVMESRRPKMNIVEPQTTPSGATIWLKTSKVPLFGQNGEVFGVLGLYEDITELKKAEDQLRASLQEKEVMLKEIHHRVKNNMQMISTLFDLQLKYGGDQDPPTVFRDCQNRIRSMALVHESLYHTDTLASINFRHYLEKLVNRLLASFSSSLQGVRAQVSGAELHLGINQAVPAGLVASEIIVNCLKHAFPGPRSGEIHISLELANGRRLIEIRDNGVGLDREFSLENPATFGWLMISNLMKQLEGEITVISDGGTTCRLVF
jgi:PAS domain S-box-containing protein